MIDNYFIHSIDWDIKYFSVDIKQTEKTFFASIKMLVDTANPTNSPINIDSLIEQCTLYFNHNKDFFKVRDQIINFIPEVKREHLHCYHTIMQKVLGSDIKIFLWSTEGYSPKVIDQQLPLLSITPSNLSRSNSISSSSSTITASTNNEVNKDIKTFTIISFLNNTTGIYSFAPLIKF
jgi:Mg2+ and Co2+ transporter CorA